MQLPEKDALQLVRVGLTAAQAQLFLILQQIGASEARTIAKKANFPRQEVYRVLDELQGKGLLEKIVSTPNVYKPIPLKEALAIIIETKAEEYSQVLESTQEILKSYEGMEKAVTPESDFVISLIEGKKTIFLRTLKAHSNATKSVDCCTTCARWTQIGYEISEAIQGALDRGVKYRTVLDRNSSVQFSEQMRTLMNNKNYTVRLSKESLKINVTIFDNTEASLNFYPSRNIDESPVLWTNHLSLIVSFQTRFEKVWENAEKINSISP